MNLHRVARLAALTVGLMLPALVRADVFTLNFTANGFAAGAPQNPVSGSFTYEAASATSPVTALDSVNLTIAGHTYALVDIGFLSPYGGGPDTVIGGVSNGVADVTSGTDDFYLVWTTATDVPDGFLYSTPDHGNYGASSFQSFSITPAAVPEPSSVVLLLTIAAGLTLSLRRLRTTVTRGIRST
jgi:hypothetical protein